MSYFVRVFCTSPEVPPLDKALKWTTDQGINLKIDPEFNSTDLSSPSWEQIGLVYKEGKVPLLIEINRDDESPNCLCREEIEEFKESLKEVEDSSAKNKVLDHLSRTKYIVASRIPTDDIDDDGYDANGIFLEYFAKNYGGMIQTDGEGFYENRELILELE